mgnify:CR=1 FL=1
MQVFYWDKLSDFKNTKYFSQGTGISVGCFDGLHLGHQFLLEHLISGCKKNNLFSGVISFLRPLPSLKHKDDYKGDITTLNQRLIYLEDFGIDFAIIVDFNDAFASIKGNDFLSILMKECNMKFIAEGVDFRCGYKGTTDMAAISYFAKENNLLTDFVEPVIYKEGSEYEERVSSSFIRQMILKGFFSTVKELLKKPYTLDLSKLSFQKEKNGFSISCSQILQIIPQKGIYHCKTPQNEDIRVEITSEKLILSNPEQFLSFN